MNVNPNSQLSSTSVVDWQVKNPVDDDVIFSLERRGVNERSLSHFCFYSFFSLLFSSLPLLSAARSLRAARTREGAQAAEVEEAKEREEEKIKLFSSSSTFSRHLYFPIVGT